MSALAFTGDMARLQQAIAESHDLVVRRSTVLEALNLRTGARVLELGCGGGYYAYEAARFVGRTGQVCAIDISPDQVAAAQRRCAEFGWLECRTADIAAPPYADAAFDAVLPCRCSSIWPISTPACGRSAGCRGRAGGLSLRRRIRVRRCGIPKMHRGCSEY
jgi:protein-L-isoaspartate O-methyltransferase